MDVDELYDRLVGQGFEYGPVFQGLRAIWRRGDEIFAEVRRSPKSSGMGLPPFGVHPALLDGAFHAGGANFWDTDTAQESRPRLPFSFGAVELYASGASSLRVCLSPTGDGVLSLAIADGDGRLVASIESLVTREISQAQLGVARGAHRDSLFRMDWRTVEVSPEPAVGEMVLLGGEGSTLARALDDSGRSVVAHPDLASLGGMFAPGETAPQTVLVDCRAIYDGRQSTQESLAGMISVGGEGGGLGGGAGLVRVGVEGVLGLVRSWLLDERFLGFSFGVCYWWCCGCGGRGGCAWFGIVGGVGFGSQCAVRAS